jgi:ATP-dependent Clp protease adaptor protein ClpS
VEAPKIHSNPVEAKSPLWMVTVYDNPHNTYEEVISILMIATGCNEEEAAIETWEIDHLGQSVVHRASEDTCEATASTIMKIGIRAEVSQEA